MVDRIDYTIAPWDRTDSVSRALVRLITQSTNDGIWDWNLETDEVYYSPRWLELVGYLPNELPGHIDTFVKLLHPDDRENGERTIAEYLSGTRSEYRNEFRLQHKDGSWRWIFTHGIVLRDSAGRAIRLAGTHTDISDRVRAAERLESIVEERTVDLRAARDELARLFEIEEARALELAKSLEDLRAAQDRLIQTEKLASLGQLTAGIAHEIKNPLNFVNNFSALSAEMIDEINDVLKSAALKKKPREELQELTQILKSNLEKVVRHGKRADAIVKNMLLHSREGSDEHRSVDINTIVEESLNLAYHGARAEKQGFTITMERSFDPTAGEVDLFPQEITRALLNLISNGFYAATRRKGQAGHEGYEPVLTAATKNLDDRVEIRIRDNGTGIPHEVKQKIFNPFFTTKPAGEGTGLGLSMSHDIIVKQHGGKIDVDTEPGVFTEFIVTLPRG
jgi:PAS domain S-box-containing protein